MWVVIAITQRLHAAKAYIPLLSQLVDTPPLLVGSVEWGEGAAAYAAMRRLRDAGAIQGPWQRGIGQRYRYLVLQEYMEGQTLKDLCYDVAAHSESAAAGEQPL